MFLFVGFGVRNSSIEGVWQNNTSAAIDSSQDFVKSYLRYRFLPQSRNNFSAIAMFFRSSASCPASNDLTSVLTSPTSLLTS